MKALREWKLVDKQTESQTELKCTTSSKEMISQSIDWSIMNHWAIWLVVSLWQAHEIECCLYRFDINMCVKIANWTLLVYNTLQRCSAKLLSVSWRFRRTILSYSGTGQTFIQSQVENHGEKVSNGSGSVQPLCPGIIWRLSYFYETEILTWRRWCGTRYRYSVDNSSTSASLLSNRWTLVVHLSFNWLIDCFIGWLIDWLIDCCSVGWLTNLVHGIPHLRYQPCKVYIYWCHHIKPKWMTDW